MKSIITLFISVIFITGIFSQSGDTLSTSSGLKYIIQQSGKGRKAEVGKTVEVHYTGWLVDGKKFDSSRDRDVTFEFVLGAKQVIKGWDEGLALMRVGDKFRLILPPDLAYGNKSAGDIIPANATLIFDVELIGVHKTRKPVADTLMEVILNGGGVEKAEELYYDLKYDYEDDYNFKEEQLNILGYKLLEVDMKKEAIAIFKINVNEFPKSFNTYDSLGEGYMLDGDKKMAIKYYEISLRLNPDNTNAKKMLEKLKSK